MKRNTPKTPFEFNQVNAYLWNQEGKKHFWGIKGKDYGLIESPNTKDKHRKNNVLP